MLSITGLWKINVTWPLPETSLVESRRDQGNPHMSEFGLFSCVYVRGGQRVDCDRSQMELVGSRLKQEQERMGQQNWQGGFLERREALDCPDTTRKAEGIQSQIERCCPGILSYGYVSTQEKFMKWWNAWESGRLCVWFWKTCLWALACQVGSKICFPRDLGFSVMLPS